MISTSWSRARESIRMADGEAHCIQWRGKQNIRFCKFPGNVRWTFWYLSSGKKVRIRVMQRTRAVLTVLGRKFHSYIAQVAYHAGQHKMFGLKFFFLEQWKITETANLSNMWNIRIHQGEKSYRKNKEEKEGGIYCINSSIKKGNETVQRGRIRNFETSTEYSSEDCEVTVEEMVYALLEEAAVVRNEKCRQRHKQSQTWNLPSSVAFTAISRDVNTLQRSAIRVATTTEDTWALFLCFCAAFFTYK